MPVEKTTAWRTSTGQCFGKKSEAYHEEMIWLVKTRGESNTTKIFSEDALTQAVEQQEDLVRGLTELKDGLHPGRDKKILAELVPLVERADSWLTDAKKLQHDMEMPDEGE